MKSKKKVLIVFGTRPDAIKLVPLIRLLKLSLTVELKICVSAQHRDMLDSVLNEYDVRPDYDLRVMRESQTLDYVTSEIVSGVGKIIDASLPDLTLVHGDTTTAFAASLAAFYRQIPIGHIEAGLRSGNILSPHPEEFNRRAISLMASYHFAPTDNAKNALICEGIHPESIFTVGNTAIDTLRYNLCHPSAENLSELTGGKRYILITVHRREHNDEKLSDIFSALRRICMDHPEIQAIYPLHKNPRLRQKAIASLGGIANMSLCEPLPARVFHTLLYKAYMVMTDSGGIQEEAGFLGKPTLVLRDTTERPEGIDAGVLKLVGTDPHYIYQSAKALLSNGEIYSKMAHSTNVFGDGHASERITEIIEKL